MLALIPASRGSECRHCSVHLVGAKWGRKSSPVLRYSVAVGMPLDPPFSILPVIVHHYMQWKTMAAQPLFFGRGRFLETEHDRRPGAAKVGIAEAFSNEARAPSGPPSCWDACLSRCTEIFWAPLTLVACSSDIHPHGTVCQTRHSLFCVAHQQCHPDASTANKSLSPCSGVPGTCLQAGEAA